MDTMKVFVQYIGGHEEAYNLDNVKMGFVADVKNNEILSGEVHLNHEELGKTWSATVSIESLIRSYIPIERSP
jgi:hypothetical protein